MKDFNVTVRDSASLYDSLSRLTLNRSGNRGTLAVGIGEGGSYTLSCVNHKILGRNNYEVTRENANELRDIVFIAVCNELNKKFSEIHGNAAGAEKKDAVTAKFDEVLDAFKTMIYSEGCDVQKIDFTRKDIEGVLLNVNALKDTLDIDCLMKMDAESLAHLAEGGNRTRANQVKVESQMTTSRSRIFKSKVDGMGADQVLETCKPLLSDAFSRFRNLVPACTKVVDRLLAYAPSRKGEFIGGKVEFLWRGIKELLADNMQRGACRMTEDMVKRFRGFLDQAEEYGKPDANKGDVAFVEDAFALLKDYKSQLDNSVMAYNANLEKCGIKALRIGNDGNVTIGNVAAEQRDELIKADFKKLADIMTSPIASEKSAAIGLDFGPEGIVSKLRSLIATGADEAADENGNLFELKEIGAAFNFGVDAVPEDHDGEGRFKESFLKGEFKSVLAEQCRSRDLKAHIAFAANFFATMSLRLQNSAQKTNAFAKEEYASIFNKLRAFAQGCNATNGKDFLDRWKSELNQNWDPEKLDDAADVAVGAREDKAKKDDEIFKLRQEKIEIFEELNRVLEIAVGCYDEEG